MPNATRHSEPWEAMTAIVDAGCAAGIHVTPRMVLHAVNCNALEVASRDPLRITTASANRWLNTMKERR